MIYIKYIYVVKLMHVITITNAISSTINIRLEIDAMECNIYTYIRIYLHSKK